MENEFINKYQDKIQGVLGCYGRVVIKGTLYEACHAGGMMFSGKKEGARQKQPGHRHLLPPSEALGNAPLKTYHGWFVLKNV